MSPEEFTRVYLPLGEELYRAAYRLLGSQAEAEDALQDLYVKLWAARDTLDAVRSPQAWSRTMLRNLCIDRLRARELRACEELGEHPEEPPPDRSDRADRALQAVRSLGPKNRALLRMRLVEGLSYAEIARQTGQSELALRVSYYRIKNKLKKKI